MSRYIDADKLKNHYAWWNDENKEIFDSIIDAQPTADVKEVVRGEWVEKNHNGRTLTHCSNCDHILYPRLWGSLPVLMPTPFCELCGADMRGEDEI